MALALRRFRQLLERHGATRDYNRHAYYHKGSQVRRAKRFKKKGQTRYATILAKLAGEQ